MRPHVHMRRLMRTDEVRAPLSSTHVRVVVLVNLERSVIARWPRPLLQSRCERYFCIGMH